MPDATESAALTGLEVTEGIRDWYRELREAGLSGWQADGMIRLQVSHVLASLYDDRQL